MGKKLRPYLFALVFPLFLGLLYSQTKYYLGDTDRYYHFALSKILSDQRAIALQTLPQAEDVTWGEFFPDKEFLFHVVTSIAYRIGGDTGVVVACLLAAAGTAWVLYFFALTLLPAPIALLVALGAFSTHSLVLRLTLVRPHVLAIFLFLLLQVALLRKKPWLVGAAAAAYVLAYHAFYLPIICFALAALLSRLEANAERKQWEKLLFFGAIGLVLGILLNPYFPANVHLGVLHAKIPWLMKNDLKKASFGMELYPVNGPSLLKFYFFPFLVMMGACVALSREKAGAKIPGTFQSRYLVLLSAFFGVLTFQTVRSGEYLIPVAGLLFAWLLVQLPQRWRAGTAGAVAAVQLIALGIVARTEASFTPDEELYRQIWSAVEKIPPGPAKVYNCEWDSAPYIFYRRPDLRFVELLDPSFLYDAAPNSFFLREELRAGLVSDPRLAMNGFFKSDFVLCRNRNLVEQLKLDPGFQQLYPAEAQASGVHLFKIASSSAPAFVRRYRVERLAFPDAPAARQYAPSPSEKLKSVDLPDSMVVIGLRNQRRPGLNCVRAQPLAEEMKRLQGAHYLGVGGGAAIRAWRNDRLVFASGPGFPVARSIQALVKLDPPLKNSDRIDLLVCSGEGQAYWSVVLSLWTEKGLAQACEEKRKMLSPRLQSEALYTMAQNTCIGPLAEPTLPNELR